MAVLRKLSGQWDIALALVISLVMGAVYFRVNANTWFGFLSLGALLYTLSQSWERTVFRLACRLSHPRGYWFYQSSIALYGVLVAGGMLVLGATGWVYAVFFLNWVFALNAIMWMGTHKRRFKDMTEEDVCRVYGHNYRDPLVKGYAKRAEEPASQPESGMNHEEP